MQNFIVEVNQQEIQALVQLIDAGLRHLGLSAAPNAVHFQQKLASAVPAPEKPATDEPEITDG